MTKALFLAGLCLLLASCGFTPVNAPGQSGTALHGRVQVIDPETRNDFLLVQRLEERLGRASAPAYVLSFDIAVEEKDLAIDLEGDVRRFNLIGETTYALRDIQSGEVRASGKVDTFTGFSATGTTVAALAAERDANARLMQILADEIVVRLQATDLGL